MDNIYQILTPFTYLILVFLWGFILFFYVKRMVSRRMRSMFNVLIVILAIDAFRTLFESLYFGVWYTSLSGFIPGKFGEFLMLPEAVFIPKVVNVVAAVIIIVMLLKRWLPEEEGAIKRLEKEVRDSELNLDKAQKMASVGSWVWNTARDRMRWSDEMCSIYGLPEGSEPTRELLGDRVHPDDLERFEEAMTQGLEGEGSAPFEYRIVMEDGVEKRIRAVVEMDSDVDGARVRMLGSAQDITELRKASDALAKSEARARLMADSVPVLIGYVDKEHRFQFANKAYEDWFERAILGKRLREAWGDEMYERILPRVEAALAGNPQVFEIEVPYGDGKKRFVQVRYVPDMGEGGEALGFYSVIVDLTDLRRAQEEKARLEMEHRRSQKLETIGTMAGGIAHDFNNLLTPILGYTQMGLDSINSSDPLYEDLEQVVVGAHRAKELVEQILLFSRQVEKERKPLELQILVNEALKLLRSSIPATVQFESKVDASCAKVFADASQMHQVVVNLCANAWQAMENEGGNLKVELGQVRVDADMARKYPNLNETDYVRLSVIDTGEGMDEESVERIFEPFYSTKAGDNRGTGLGLSVVHGIVRAHGGDILVDSELGKGSAFHVYIPVADEVVDERSLEKAPTIQGGEESILIVDDEKMITNLYRKGLSRYGYVVDSYNDSIEALEAFRRNPGKYDLVISDLTMPNMTGLELAKKLQEVRSEIPIIIVTGYSSNLREDAVKEYGIRRVLKKPIVMSELASAVRSVSNN